MSTIAIAGAHGQIARLLTRMLVADGDRVRGLIRNPDHADDLRADGAEPVVCDLESASVDEVAGKIDGADAVVFAAGAGPGSGTERKATMDRDGAILLRDAAVAAGVGRYVMVSAVGAENPPPEGEGDTFGAYLRAKADADRALAESELDWTIVRPGMLTDDDPTGRLRLSREPFRDAVAARRRRERAPRRPALAARASASRSTRPAATIPSTQRSRHSSRRPAPARRPPAGPDGRPSGSGRPRRLPTTVSMAQISMPYRIALIAIVALALVWFLALRPKEDEGGEPAAPPAAAARTARHRPGARAARDRAGGAGHLRAGHDAGGGGVRRGARRGAVGDRCRQRHERTA